MRHDVRETSTFRRRQTDHKQSSLHTNVCLNDRSKLHALITSIAVLSTTTHVKQCVCLKLNA